MQLVTTLHGWTNLSGRAPLYVRIDKWCLPFYRAAICVSEDLVDACDKIGVPSSRCHLIHNAIDTDDYRRTTARDQAKTQLGLPANELLVGAVGRLSPEKGFDQLIRAVVALRNAGRPVHLAIAGEGDARHRLEQLITDLGCQSFVRLLGHVADPRRLYEAMDLFALSSLREGLPNAVLEAMALEVPVVATRIAGLPKLIQDGVDGVLVPPANLPALTSAIDRLLCDEGTRMRLSQAGRQTIEARFSFSRRMERVAAVYDQVLGRESHTCNFAERTDHNG